MSSPDQTSDEGFTLVEVLLGLMLTAILVASLATLASQFRTFLNVSDRIERSVELNKVARKVAEIVEQAERLPIIRNEDNQDVFLAGQSNTIAFVATLKTGLQLSRFRDIRILTNDMEHLVIEVSYRRPVAADHPKPTPDIIELMAGNIDVNFRYLDFAAPSKQDRWTDNWNRTAKLPRAVQIKLTKKLSDGRSFEAVAIAQIFAE